MALVTVKPTRIDTALASEIADNTNSGLEHTAQVVTWAADEHVLLALAAAGWLFGQFQRPRQRAIANHVLAVSVAAAVLPHVLKSVFDQTRADRLTGRGHLRGVSLSGRARDGFSSRHPLPMGGLASTARPLSPGP